jgi:hypothetical protein
MRKFVLFNGVPEFQNFPFEGQKLEDLGLFRSLTGV